MIFTSSSNTIPENKKDVTALPKSTTTNTTTITSSPPPSNKTENKDCASSSNTITENNKDVIVFPKTITTSNTATSSSANKPTLMVVNFFKIIDAILKDNNKSYDTIKEVEKKIKSEPKLNSNSLYENTQNNDDNNTDNGGKKNKKKKSAGPTTPTNNSSPISNVNNNNNNNTPQQNNNAVSTSPTNISTPIKNGSPTNQSNKATPKNKTILKMNKTDTIPSKTKDRNHSFINIIKNIIISMSEIYKLIKVDVLEGSGSPEEIIIRIKKNFTTLSALYGQIFEKTKFYDPVSLNDVDFVFWRIFSMKKRLSKVDLSNISIGTPLRNSFQHHNYVYDKDSFELYYEFLESYYLSEYTSHEFKQIEKSFINQTKPDVFKVLIFNLNEKNNYYYIDYFREEELLTLCRYFMAYSHCLYAILTCQLNNVPLPETLYKLLVDKYGIQEKEIQTKEVTSEEIVLEIEKKSSSYLTLSMTIRPNIFDLIEETEKKETKKVETEKNQVDKVEPVKKSSVSPNVSTRPNSNRNSPDESSRYNKVCRNIKLGKPCVEGCRYLHQSPNQTPIKIPTHEMDIQASPFVPRLTLQSDTTFKKK